MGAIDNDHLLTVGLLNTLGEPFSHLQSAIQTLSSAPNFDSTSVIRRIEEEENLIKCHTDGGHLPTPSHVALTASSTRPPRVPCSTCKRLNHSTEFCILPGGRLAGKTIDQTRAAQAAHRTANRPTRSPPVTFNRTCRLTTANFRTTLQVRRHSFRPDCTFAESPI
jgi:hypothetical protein